MRCIQNYDLFYGQSCLKISETQRNSQSGFSHMASYIYFIIFTLFYDYLCFILNFCFYYKHRGNSSMVVRQGGGRGEAWIQLALDELKCVYN